VAFLGVLLSHLLQRAWIDGAASIVIGLILGTVAVLLARESKGLLLGESADRELLASIGRILEADRAVAEVVRTLTLQLGPEEVLLNLEVRFAPGVDGAGITSAVQRLEAAFRQECPALREIFIEPVVS
jgi:divalent metal cation (Fe/Co/Zn/Cd) transporter